MTQQSQTSTSIHNGLSGVNERDVEKNHCNIDRANASVYDLDAWAPAIRSTIHVDSSLRFLDMPTWSL